MNIFENVERANAIGFMRDGHIDYSKAVKFLNMDKKKIAKASGLAVASVRFDERMPTDLKTYLNELLTVVDLVYTHLDKDIAKTKSWLMLPNPLLGGVSPLHMIHLGKQKKLLKFIESSIAGDI